jgi:hypothetical protein
VNGLALEWHGAAESGAGLRRHVLLETSLECEVPGMNNELAHLSNLAKLLGRVATMEICNIAVI